MSFTSQINFSSDHELTNEIRIYKLSTLKEWEIRNLNIEVTKVLRKDRNSDSLK